MIDKPREYHINVTDKSQIALDILHQQTDFSRQKIKQIMLKGAVWLTRGQSTQRLRRVKKVLQIGDVLHVYYNAAVLNQEPHVPELIDSTPQYSVWFKPKGMLSQGSKWGDHCAISRWVEQHHDAASNVFIVHRLDKATSGLLLLAHSKKTAAHLSRQFEQRQVTKRYLAVVDNQSLQAAMPQTVDAPVGGKPAISHLSVVESSERYTLLEVKIDTGRKHQIRIHLAGLGAPIVGDRMYGDDQSPKHDLQLTAYHLAFVCPLSGQVKRYELDKALWPTLKLDKDE